MGRRVGWKPVRAGTEAGGRGKGGKKKGGGKQECKVCQCRVRVNVLPAQQRAWMHDARVSVSGTRRG